jgi:hypothetical protein
MPRLVIKTDAGEEVGYIELTHDTLGPLEYWPEVEELIRDGFTREGAPLPDWLSRGD